MAIKLTEAEKREVKLMRMFEYHFRNYDLDFTKSEATEGYFYKETLLMFFAYIEGYNKGSNK